MLKRLEFRRVFFFSSRSGQRGFGGGWGSGVSPPILRRPDPPAETGLLLHAAVTGLRLTDGPLLDGAGDLLRAADRKSVVQGKSVDLGGRRIIKKKNKQTCGLLVQLTFVSPRFRSSMR